MSEHKAIDTVAVVGGGVVGRGWLPVFARGGCVVRIYDAMPAQADKALEWAKTFLQMRAARGEMSDQDANDCIARMTVCRTLEEAIESAQYIQESIQEDLALKQALFARLDALAEPNAILASSTSALDIEDVCRGLARADRCITAHPFNPAAILPAVEVLGTRRAKAGFLEGVEAFLVRVGQRPIRMHKFSKGYIGNRLQLALMREAFDIVEKGIASTEAVDTVLSEALALRWALLGTFGTNHTNADGGIRDYYTAFGTTLKALMNDLTADSPAFDAAMIERYGRELEQRFQGMELPELRSRRDEFVCAIQGIKHRMPANI